VGNNLIIAIVYDHNVQKSRIGMVWLYTRRAIEDLSELVEDMGDMGSSEALDEDFGDSLMEEFDAFFSGERRIAGSEGPSDSMASEQRMFEQRVPDAADDVFIGAPSLSDALHERQAERRETASPKEASSGSETPSEESEGELFSMEEAIKQGLIPSDLLNQ
jgi:hypothetical protein